MAINQHAPTHEVSSTGTSRGERGKRMISYGHCICGRGTTNSTNRESVLAKLKAHANGDERGMHPTTPKDHERMALAAERRIQPAQTQDERERWQRIAEYHWGLA